MCHSSAQTKRFKTQIPNYLSNCQSVTCQNVILSKCQVYDKMSVMYEFELEIIVNKKSFFRTITADTFQEALEFGNMMYPEAEYVELC